MAWMGGEHNRHYFTKEDKIKGGKATSEKKTLANRFKARKYCNASCPIYPCPYEPVTYQDEYTEKKGERVYRFCVVKKLPLKIQRGLLKLIIPDNNQYGEFLAELLTLLHAKVATNENIGNIQRMIDNTIKVKETIFGKKAIVEAQIKGDVGISFEELRNAYKKINDK